jgi:hypothetical protein
VAEGAHQQGYFAAGVGHKPVAVGIFACQQHIIGLNAAAVATICRHRKEYRSKTTGEALGQGFSW